jgi:hypothetical protein
MHSITRTLKTWDAEEIIAENETQPESVRMIQGNRAEIFLFAKDKSATIFDGLAASTEQKLGLAPGSAKNLLFLYVKRRVARDPRFRSEEFDINNLSIIATWGSVQAQEWHIDLRLPNCQGALFLTANTPPTLVSASQLDGIHDETTLARVLGLQHPHDPAVQALLSNTRTKHLLANFGAILQPRSQFTPLSVCLGEKGTRTASVAGAAASVAAAAVEMKVTATTDEAPAVGDIIVTDGSIVHAGPSCDRFRAIAFFSITPKTGAQQATVYDPDVQYTGVTLMATLADEVWPHVRPSERTTLLSALATRIVQTYAGGHFGICHHINEEAHIIRNFIQAVEEKIDIDDGPVSGWKDGEPGLLQLIASTAKQDYDN